MSIAAQGVAALPIRGPLSAGRERMLVMTAMLIGLLMIGAALALPAQPGSMAWQAPVLAICGGLMLLTALLLGWTQQQRALVDAHARLAALTGEQRFRIVFEQSTAGIGLIDVEARWLEVNTRLAEMLGYQPEELCGRLLCELLPEDGRRERKARLLAALVDPARAGAEMRDEGIWLHRDGHPVWVSRHVRFVDGDLGQPARAVLIVVDISDRVRAEAEAAERKRHEAFHFEHLPLAMIEWDRDLRVRRWSRQAEIMLGWPAEAVVGRTLREAGVLDADEADDHEQVMGEFLSGQRIEGENLRCTRHRDGRQAWYRWYSHSLAGADGRPEFFFTAGLDVTEFLDNNLRLDENRRELRAIFEQAAVGIAMLDAEGRWLSVNRRFCDIVGRSEAALLSTDFQSITHPDDLAIDVAQAEAVATGGLPRYAMEKRYLGPDGAIIWVRLHVGRIDATATTPMRFVSVIEDIGERKRAEQQALEHQRVRDFHIDNTPLAVIEWTPDLRVRRWSVHAVQMFGWSEAEVLGSSPFDWRFFHEDDLDRAAEIARTIFDGPTANIQILCRNYHRDGRTVWCQWHSSIQRSASGEVQSVLSMASNVSHEQETLAALRDSQARFQGIFEQAAVGIAMIDVHGNWLMVNQRFREIVGYDEYQLLQTSCEQITEPHDRAAETAQRARLVAGEIDDYSLDKRYLRGDGTPVWVSLCARRLDDIGRFEGRQEGVRLSLVIVDITEQRQAEAQIRRLNADLERRVGERTRQLNDTVHNWVERNRELSLLTEMMGLMSAAADSGEADRIVGSYLPRLFQRYGGAVWTGDAGAAGFTLLAEWGHRPPVPALLTSDDCWALRRGRLLRIDDPAHPLPCPHLAGRSDCREPHTCVPIVALGSPVGLIHLGWSERIGSAMTPPDETLLNSVAEQIGLAIGNVRLREELRRQAIRDPRSADRPLQPPPVRRGAADPDGRERSPRPQLLGADDRHRSLQADQRRTRPRNRRRGAARNRPAPAGIVACRRGGVPFRRRGVRAADRRQRRSGRQPSAALRRAPAPGDRRTARAGPRPQPATGHGVDRRRRLSTRCRAPGQPAGTGRCRAVQRQADRPRPGLQRRPDCRRRGRAAALIARSRALRRRAADLTPEAAGWRWLFPGRAQKGPERP